jgi:hypothetical protein
MPLNITKSKSNVVLADRLVLQPCAFVPRKARRRQHEFGYIKPEPQLNLLRSSDVTSAVDGTAARGPLASGIVREKQRGMTGLTLRTMGSNAVEDVVS